MFAICAGILLVCFAAPLYDLVLFAAQSSLFSHILLIPFISVYLVWVERASLPQATKPILIRALLPLASGLGVLAVYWFYSRDGVASSTADHLTWTTMAFVLMLVALCFP